MSVNAGPNSRAGKPLNVGDQVTVVGFITAIAAGTSPSTAVTVQWAGSGNISTGVQAQDCGASSQTL
jgi:hypothetical protein